MTIDRPTASQISGLRQLWQGVFGDTDAFVNNFFAVGFSPDRCRCIAEDGQILSMLYWFDGKWEGKPVAYLYAVATAEACRGRGLCHRLMEDTHRHLAALGYAGAVLVPANASLFDFYSRMGYRPFSALREFSCTAGNVPQPLEQISPAEYAQLRRSLLPEGSVIQEGATLAFLSTYARFYKGEGFLLAAVSEGDILTVPELLGNASNAPGIVAALGMQTGHFRTPGAGRNFSMYRSLTEESQPKGYFGLALD